MIFLEKPKNFEKAIHVVGCFLECDGKILLLLRDSKKDGGDRWGTPGGKVEIDDVDFESALIREVFEETGVKIERRDLVNICVYYVIHPNNKKFIYTKYSIVLPNKPDVILREEEHKEFTWATPEESLKMSLIMHEDFIVKHTYGIK